MIRSAFSLRRGRTASRTRAAAIRAAAFVVAAALAATPVSAGRILEGRVVAVIDGDTLDLLSGGAQTRIRIAGIDTPERGQPWASRARQALAERVFGREVRVNEVTTDAYGRTVGEVYADDVCVGCELVREGHAWAYRGFTDDEVLFRMEAEARAARRGLWSLPEAERVPPWEWRRARRERERERAERPGETAAPAFRCGAKRYCREMQSCAEARFHLERCGLTRLDGDGDGIPCEKLCRGR